MRTQVKMCGEDVRIQVKVRIQYRSGGKAGGTAAAPVPSRNMPGQAEHFLSIII